MLVVNNIYKKFNLEAGFFAAEKKYVYAVNGVSFTINPLESYGLVGESGCGKTTTARLAVRMYRHNGGTIHYTDNQKRCFDYARLTKTELKELRNKIKYIFQDPARSLNPRMNVLEILTAGYRYSGLWPGRDKARQQASHIMEDVGLSAGDLDRRPADFSGGQRQRISIARALIMRPQLLICDEVVSALDVSIQSQILNLLIRLKREHGFQMLFIAHDLAVVSYICDRIGVMYAGQLMEEALSLELVHNRLHPYTRQLYASIPKLTDDDGDSTKITIAPGEVPNLTREIQGCPYAARCYMVQNICRTERPLFRKVSKAHHVACHFV